MTGCFQAVVEATEEGLEMLDYLFPEVERKVISPVGSRIEVENDPKSVIEGRDPQLERAVARGVPEARARGLLEAQTPLIEKRGLASGSIDKTVFDFDIVEHTYKWV